MTTEWEFKYPLVSIRALDQGVSDHTPLLLDTCTTTFTGNGSKFRLELTWFTHDEFRERVTEIWNKPIRGNNPVQRWNNKLTALHHYLRDGQNTSLAFIKKPKAASNRPLTS
jgi:hypothetical protein